MINRSVAQKCLTFVLLIAFLLPIAAGGNGAKKEGQQETIRVTDQIGREVVVKKNPQKIVSSYYISTAMLIALGVKEKVVGIEMKAQSRPLYRRSAPEFIDLPAVGSGKTINVEACLALGADLVIIPYRLEEAIPQFDKARIPVIAVMPETLDLFLDSVTFLGKVTGSEKKAAEFRGFYEEEIASIRSITDGITERPRVYISGSKNPLITATGKMYQTNMIALAGGANVSAHLKDGYWTAVSAEDLILWNPHFIFPVRYASYDVKTILNDERFQKIEAVDGEHVTRFPSPLEPWDYPTPSSLLGILWLTNQLHPDKYSEAAYTETAREFYTRFFAFEATDSEIGL